MPSPSPTRHIVIIGGGFAGAVAAIKLIEAITEPFALTVVETSPEIGRGIAYGVADYDYLINGPAKAFALYPDDPAHLTRWLEANAGSFVWRPESGQSFADSAPPRRLCGDYVVSELRSALARAQTRVEFVHVRDRATAIEPSAERCIIELASGERLVADQAILATGLFRSSPPFAQAGAQSWRYIDNPWKPASYARAAEAKSVLILGAGLTMLDALITLEKNGFRGEYLAISRRGRVVNPRHDAAAWPDFLGASPPTRALALLQRVQAERRKLARAGEDWQRLAPSIRPHLGALWSGAALDERKRFIRHLRPFWELALHRAPPASYAVLERIEASGRFDALAAKVQRVEAGEGDVAVTFRRRGAAENETRAFDLVVNALGHEFDWRRIDDPLIRQLLASGAVRPHETGFGVDADPATKAVIGADGVASRRLFAIGHPLRGVSWESNAASEQVPQAIELAAALARLPAKTPEMA